MKDIKNHTYKVLMYYLAKFKYGDIGLVNKLNTAHLEMYWNGKIYKTINVYKIFQNMSLLFDSG